MKWVKHPLILEINTMPWLYYLSEKYSDKITLKNIPEEVMDELEHYNFIWMMGVWNRSETSEGVAREHRELQNEFREGLPEYIPEDIIGSPYAIKNYLDVYPSMLNQWDTKVIEEWTLIGDPSLLIGE